MWRLWLCRNFRYWLGIGSGHCLGPGDSQGSSVTHRKFSGTLLGFRDTGLGLLFRVRCKSDTSRNIRLYQSRGKRRGVKRDRVARRVSDGNGFILKIRLTRVDLFRGKGIQVISLGRCLAAAHGNFLD